MGTTYKAGTWNLLCDVCGKKIKSSEAKHRWDGFIVCKDDYETRHPVDFIKVKPDNFKIPFSRPEPADQFSSITYIDTGDSPYCTPPTSTGAADVCTANCARADIAAIGL